MQPSTPYLDAQQACSRLHSTRQRAY
jgi:hypothetical protein